MIFHSDDTCVALNWLNSTKKSPCIFPFNYKGKDYEACTNFGHTQHWCSTKVDTNGTHIVGQWGDCGELCPKVDGKCSKHHKRCCNSDSFSKNSTLMKIWLLQ